MLTTHRQSSYQIQTYIDAFKFALHLVEDVHMPLHAGAIARESNAVKVLFGGANLSLHLSGM